MTRIVTSLGDWILSRALKTTQAGATTCVWNYGYSCGCYGVYQYLIDCNGVCRRTPLGCM